MLRLLLVTGVLFACGKSAPAVMPAPPIAGPAWFSFGRDPQHTAVSAIATQELNRIAWSTPVDTDQQFTLGELLAHYGSPVITSNNTVVLPVKIGDDGDFRIEARSGVNGGLIWSVFSDYVEPPHEWLPPYGLTLDSANRLYAAGEGGKLYVWSGVDSANPPLTTRQFYGGAVDPSIVIDTPIAVDAAGTAYFGFLATGANLQSGLARIDAAGVASWVPAATLAGDSAITQVAMNSAPAISADGSTIYVAVDASASPNAYLLALDSASLAVKSRAALIDPATGAPALVSDNATSSPTIGPDGDVYFGVIESALGQHGGRGWLLHFDAGLTTVKTPGGFGWDDTASIVPASLVSSYTGTSTYLLMTKFNDYGGGQNRVAIFDPGAAETDSISSVQIMKAALVIGGEAEFCVNTAAVDPATKSILVNEEDGFLYRWDLTTNAFTQKIQLGSGLGEAYTPTAIGADGAVYAISDSILFSIQK
jgi:hypothetical protein